jgi:hypothetical protein
MNDTSTPETQILPAASSAVTPSTAVETSTPAALEATFSDLPKRPFIRWRKLLTLAAIYTATETALDLAGLDTLANYSEFIQNGQAALQVVGDTIVSLAHLIP